MDQYTLHLTIFVIEFLFFSLILGTVTFLVLMKTRGRQIGRTIIHFLLTVTHGLLVSSFILIFGRALGISEQSLWISSAIGVLLGVEIYYLWLSLLAEMGSQWAKRLLEDYRDQ